MEDKAQLLEKRLIVVLGAEAVRQYYRKHLRRWGEEWKQNPVGSAFCARVRWRMAPSVKYMRSPLRNSPVYLWQEVKSWAELQ